MAKKNNHEMTIETIERQINYVREQEKSGLGGSVIFPAAFLRGMRDIGYKSPSWAIAEMIDNAFQAAAHKVSIRFGFNDDNESRSKPDYIAVVDDGNGMIEKMIGYAVRWGGTDRENDRKGFGRYGYGLPSAAVSLAKRYTVFSRYSGKPWHGVTVDVEALALAAGDPAKTEKLLTANEAKLPDWLLTSNGPDDINLKDVGSGAVVLLEDLDRLRRMSGWIKAETLQTKLLQDLGVIYRHWIPDRRILVNGNEVQAVDPLFLMEHGRFFDETPVHAVPVPTRTVEIKTEDGNVGKVRIRASFLPPNFQLSDTTTSTDGKPDTKIARNHRHPIMRKYNGILICREHRHIDLVQPDWTKFQTYDYNIKVELDFDPVLDEVFGMTTSKQQATPDDFVWETLKHSGKNGGGLIDLVKDLRERFKESKTELDAATQNAPEDKPKPSVTAMEATEKFRETVTPPPTEEQVAEALRNLEDTAAEVAAKARRPMQEVIRQLEEETKRRKWEVEFASLPEGPFYRPKRFGEQKRLVINTEHPFFSKMYEPASPDVKSALEVLLLVLAERELESKKDAETFYKNERQRWSTRLRNALDHLTPYESLSDMASSVAEELHTTEATE
jgi:hypothetical protein